MLLKLPGFSYWVGCTLAPIWITYQCLMCLKGRVPARSCPEGMNPSDSILLNHIFIGEEIHPLVTLWKRNIWTVITPTGRLYTVCKGNAVCSVTVGLNGKAAWQITPFIDWMQLLCSYDSRHQTPRWEQNPSAKHWDLLWSCTSCSIT